MSKIKDLKKIKENLKIGEVACSDIWELDNQYSLNGNPLKAFETSLRTICNFDKTKIGRKTYYIINDIYKEIKPIEHGNKTALKGNSNKKGKRGFKKYSDVGFVASVLMNKIEYYKEPQTTSISGGKRICQLHSTYKDEEVDMRLYMLVKRAIDLLERLGFIEVQEQYMACVNNEHCCINAETYENYKEKSNSCLKEVLGDETFKRYKNYYVFDKFYKRYDKEILKDRYRELMNSNIEYTYVTYKLTDIRTIDIIYNKEYSKLLDLLFGDETQVPEEETIAERKNAFIEDLEERIKINRQEKRTTTVFGEPFE